jgi:hypothetical protein
MCYGRYAEYYSSLLKSHWSFSRTYYKMPSHLSIITKYNVKRQEGQNFRSKFHEEISWEKS